MTIRSQPLDFAVSIIAVAACAFGTCKSSAVIPICAAKALASSSTLPACSLKLASYRPSISSERAHAEADPGSGSVTVIIVTLAFKAFAKAIPCSTPFLATSDPSVVKRILAYIRPSLARQSFSPNCGLSALVSSRHRPRGAPLLRVDAVKRVVYRVGMRVLWRCHRRSQGRWKPKIGHRTGPSLPPPGPLPSSCGSRSHIARLPSFVSTLACRASALLSREYKVRAPSRWRPGRQMPSGLFNIAQTQLIGACLKGGQLTLQVGR